MFCIDRRTLLAALLISCAPTPSGSPDVGANAPCHVDAEAAQALLATGHLHRSWRLLSAAERACPAPDARRSARLLPVLAQLGRWDALAKLEAEAAQHTSTDVERALAEARALRDDQITRRWDRYTSRCS